jgi:thermitase
LTEEVIIAVIDTGVQLTHPDLKDNLWMDANGNIGTNLIRTTATADDDNGHGTHCSGLAAAMTNNNLGVAGVMPTKAKIMPIKALDSKGAGSFANITNGIYYAIDHKANVISMSLGGDSASSALRQAIVDATNAGIMVFAAAGNDGKDLSASPSYPAFYAKDIDGFMAIASIDSQTKKMSNFSNYSSDYVELAAPGSNGILSTYKGSAYAYLEGTSMATPIAAGAGLVVMSWLKSHGYVVTAANVEKILKAAAEVNLNLADLVQDSHNLNLASLANYLKTNYSSASTMPTPTPTPAPTPMLTPMPTPQPTPVITPTPTPTPKPKPTPRHRSRSSWGWRW